MLHLKTNVIEQEMQHFEKMCYNFLCASASMFPHKKPMDHIYTEGNTIIR